MAQIDPSDVAKQFTKFYYDTFDAHRAQLAPLYRPNSMLTFNNVLTVGADNIIQKLTSLPFKKVLHQATTVSVQPSISPGTLIVSVTGYLLVDDETNPIGFSQVFQLIAEGPSYYVHNDIFSLNIG